MLPPSRMSAASRLNALRNARSAASPIAECGSVRYNGPLWPGVTSIVTPLAGGHFHRNTFGQIFFQMRFRQFQNFLASLFGNETECQFRKRVAGDHRLFPLPLISAADSVDLGRRPRPDAFH